MGWQFVCDSPSTSAMALPVPATLPGMHLGLCCSLAVLNWEFGRSTIIATATAVVWALFAQGHAGPCCHCCSHSHCHLCRDSSSISFPFLSTSLSFPSLCLLLLTFAYPLSPLSVSHSPLLPLSSLPSSPFPFHVLVPLLLSVFPHHLVLGTRPQFSSALSHPQFLPAGLTHSSHPPMHSCLQTIYQGFERSASVLTHILLHSVCFRLLLYSICISRSAVRK